MIDDHLITDITVSTRQQGKRDVYVRRPATAFPWQVITGRLLQTVHLETDDLDEALARARKLARETKR